MRLTGNKKSIVDEKVGYNIYWVERNILMTYNGKILIKQSIMPFNLINSNLLINSIYDEIKKE
jgi:hypothetical protein